MKKNQIVVGGIYSNGKKGRFYSERKVIDISMDGKYKLYEEQTNQETVFYETVNGYYNNRCSKSGCMTLESFASWAKKRIL